MIRAPTVEASSWHRRHEPTEADRSPRPERGAHWNYPCADDRTIHRNDHAEIPTDPLIASDYRHFGPRGGFFRQMTRRGVARRTPPPVAAEKRRYGPQDACHHWRFRPMRVGVGARPQRMGDPTTIRHYDADVQKKVCSE